MAKGPIDRDQALLRLQQYCAFQDRCHQEVRGKLLELEIYGDELESILADLIADDFLNEERFARSFARGKFRMKQWGRRRILQELKQRDVSDYCRRQAMREIDEDEYRATLRDLVRKKGAGLAGEEPFVRRNKTAQFAIGRGFEPELVWAAVEELLPDS